MSSKLSAVATAFFLGTATLGGAVILLSVPAMAANVRPAVGNPLKEAQSLAAAGNYKAAMAKVNEAEAVPGKTADESSIIAQMKQYIGVKSGDVSIGGAPAARAKLASDYNAKKYKDVIADSEVLRKVGALDEASMQVIAQSYYLSGDKAGCVKYIKSNLKSPSDTSLELLMRCAYDINDDATQRQALETLVSHTGKPEYWASLLKLSERATGLTDHQTLDLYRLRLLTGTMTTKDDYTLLAQLALQLGFASEGKTVIEKGMAANLLTDERSKRLYALAQKQSAAAATQLPAAIAEANKAPQGDALVKVAEEQWGNGKFDDAVAMATAALKKPLKDPDNAAIVLGMAQLGAGQKAAAIKTFDGVKGKENAKMVAHLWSLFASKPPASQAAAPAAKKKR